MPLELVRDDITKMKVDAIVNAANASLLGGGGVDGAIHRAAGPELLAECRTLGGCKTGSAKVTKGYGLPCKYVIHTVGPVWQGGRLGEKWLLASCYSTSLKLAKDYGCESVAFPLISSGAYGYPKDMALRVAVNAISDFLAKNEMQVYLVIYDRAAFQISETLYSAVQAHIDDHYVETHTGSMNLPFPYGAGDRARQTAPPCTSALPDTAKSGTARPSFWHRSLHNNLKYLDESFSEMLLRKIDEKHMTDAQCYKKANIDRKLFSKIRSNKNYQPSKPTVIAFAIALELSLEETKDMLRKAGFALSHSNKFDVIVEFFIQRRCYDIFEINEVLFYYDQSLLGG